MATIKDIARRLNVSVSTVSYALNDGPRRVPPAVRDRVVEAARELGYRPNRAARSLITGRAHAIGVVPAEPARDLARMGYFHAVFNGVVAAAEAEGQDVMLLTRADADRAADLDALVDGRVDGLIVLSPHLPSPAFDRMLQAGVPFAAVSTAAPEGFPSFGCDNAAGVGLALDHLIGLGHQRIGFLAGRRDMHDGEARNRAFRDALSVRGVSLEERWIAAGEFTTSGGEAAAAHVLSGGERPTALLAANDESAYGALRWAAAHGLRVPQDLSIVGFDDAAFAAYLTPGLTTVGQPFDRMGGDALRAVVALVEGRPAVSQTYAPHLVVRSSTASPSNEGNP